jgi:hypothetical protein
MTVPSTAPAVVLARLGQELDAALEGGEGLATAAAAVVRFASGASLGELLTGHLASLAQGAAPPSFKAGSLRLHGSPSSSLYLSVLRAPKRHILLDPVDSAAILAGGGTVSCVRYAVDPPIRDRSVFSPEHRLTESERSSLHRLDAAVKRGFDETLDLAPEGRPALLLRLFSRPFAASEWTFDRASLYARNLRPIDPVMHMVIGMVEILGGLASPSSVDAIGALLSNPAHEVRSGSLAALRRIDPDKARSAAERALSDPHPEVRRTARELLSEAG